MSLSFKSVAVAVSNITRPRLCPLELEHQVSRQGETSTNQKATDKGDITFKYRGEPELSLNCTITLCVNQRDLRT